MHYLYDEPVLTFYTVIFLNLNYWTLGKRHSKLRVWVGREHAENQYWTFKCTTATKRHAEGSGVTWNSRWLSSQDTALSNQQYTKEKAITCLCFISSFFSSRKAEGIPAMFSCALKSRGHSSPINSLAFFPFKNPVRLICIILESGFCKKDMTGRETGYLETNQPINLKLI